MAVSLDCSILINGQIMLIADHSKAGFIPTIVLERTSMIPGLTTDFWFLQYIEYIEFSLIIFCILLIIVCQTFYKKVVFVKEAEVESTPLQQIETNN